jgi:hypothetical protein
MMSELDAFTESVDVVKVAVAFRCCFPVLRAQGSRGLRRGMRASPEKASP